MFEIIAVNALLLCQKRPISFSLSAIVTKTDLEFNVSEIDFGHCTIYETVTKSVQLRNRAMLPQEFGFVGLPEVYFTYFSAPTNLTCLVAGMRLHSH